MREPKGDWRDLFNGFMVALDLRKMLFAFMGLLFTLLLIGVLTYVWTVFFGEKSNVLQETSQGVQPLIPRSFTPHEVLGWFQDRWCGRAGAHNGIYHKSPFNWGCYTLLALVIFTMIWSYFGGAIARSAACEIAKEGERIETSKALKYAGKKFWSFFGAPLICVLGFLFFYLVTYVAGAVFWVLDLLWIGAPLAAVFIPLVVLAGFIMALIVVGTVAGFPLFLPAVAAEGTDAFDAFSRGFSYIYSKPWQYLWYQFVSAGYGYVCIAFVIVFAVFMTSLGLNAGEAGFKLSGLAAEQNDFKNVSNWAWSHVISEQHLKGTYGWTPAAIADNPHPYGRIMYLSGKAACADDINFKAKAPEPRLHWLASFVLLFWMIVIMGLAYSFAISYFISQQTMIYFILRKKVDDIDVKEVYLEEDMDQIEGLPGSTEPAAPATPPAEGAKPAESKPAEAPKPAPDEKTATKRRTKRDTKK
ncbi:MAG TPA: hypothetical protein VI643_05700 [Planctomycetota bacterium]|nr:hypothetical protein [Planctomycetota bacterium]